MEVEPVLLPQKRPLAFADDFLPLKIIKTEHRADISHAADLNGISLDATLILIIENYWN